MTGGRDASGGRHGGAPLVCVVANPSKPSVTERTRRRITAMISAAGCRDPLWLETTPAETGATQARLAVASGADLVLAMGGDGTVRAVAAGLAGTGVELGILAAGTANLAARNLGLPVGGLDAALEAALSTPAAPTDLAWVRPLPDSEDSADAANADATASGGAGGPSPGTALEAVPGAATRTTTDPAPAPPAAPAPAWRATGIFGARPPAVAPVAPDGGAAGGMTGRAPLTAPGSNGWARPTLGAEHACLVVAGIGFDAGLVAATSPALKARLTWGAYALAAMSKLRSPRLALSVSIDGVPPEQLTPAPS